MYLVADHSKCLSARIYVVEPWFYSTHISTKFLIDAAVGLWDYFVGIFDEAATDARCPSSCTSAAFPPAMHALSVGRYLGMVLIGFREVDVFRFSI